jgi:hypothetical protein
MKAPFYRVRVYPSSCDKTFTDYYGSTVVEAQALVRSHQESAFRIRVWQMTPKEGLSPRRVLLAALNRDRWATSRPMFVATQPDLARVRSLDHAFARARGRWLMLVEDP